MTGSEPLGAARRRPPRDWTPGLRPQRRYFSLHRPVWAALIRSWPPALRQTSSRSQSIQRLGTLVAWMGILEGSWGWGLSRSLLRASIQSQTPSIQFRFCCLWASVISSVKWVDYLNCHREDVCDYSPSWAPPPGFPNSSSSEGPNSSVPPSGLLSGTQPHNPHLLDQNPELPLDVAPSLPSNTVTKFYSFSQQRARVASTLTKLQALQE